MGNDKDIKQDIKDKFSGLLHPTWRSMHQYFLRQALHSSFNGCQQLLAHEERNTEPEQNTQMPAGFIHTKNESS